MENEIVFAKYEVTCTTQNCENSNITILIDAAQTNPFIICGVCSLQITNVVATTPK